MGDFTDEDRKMLSAVHTNVTNLMEGRRDHENRIRVVEKKVWWGSGAVAIIVGALTMIWDKIQL